MIRKHNFVVVFSGRYKHLNSNNADAREPRLQAVCVFSPVCHSQV